MDYRYSATCTASTFSTDVFCRLESMSFRRAYDFVLHCLRLDHSAMNPQFGDQTTWELRIDDKLAYTIRYSCYNWEEAKMNSYNIRIFRHHGTEGMKVIYLMDRTKEVYEDE